MDMFGFEAPFARLTDADTKIPNAHFEELMPK